MSQNNKTILITGSAGFIGSNLVLRLPESEEPLNIVGLDNLNDYYDPSLKEYRLSVIQKRLTQPKGIPTSSSKATSPTRLSSTASSRKTTSTSS